MFNNVEMTKGERTRALIRDTALASFRERGYEETTVRLIAKEAGVSLGSTNYYFPSKNHLVQELYLDVTKRLNTDAISRMSGEDDLVKRLEIAYITGIEALKPYHGFAPGFLSAAMSPKSPINPLSGESEPALAETIAVFREALAGGKHSLPDDIAEALPDVLTIGYLLLALFWTYDRSPDQRTTTRLLKAGLGLFKLALPMVRVPAIRKPIRQMLNLIAEVRS